MRPFRKDEIERKEHGLYSTTPPEVADHPLFGKGTVGLITAENPKYESHPGGTMALSNEMKSMGLQHEPTHGQHGGPENSFVVHNPTREQMYRLGNKFGQESVIYSQDGKHEMLYTHGPNAGKAHYSIPQVHFSETQPKDHHVLIPGRGYVTLHFDDQFHDTPTKWTMPLEHKAPAHDPPLAKSEREMVREFAADLTQALRKILSNHKL